MVFKMKKMFVKKDEEKYNLRINYENSSVLIFIFYGWAFI